MIFCEIWAEKFFKKALILTTCCYDFASNKKHQIFVCSRNLGGGTCDASLVREELGGIWDSRRPWDFKRLLEAIIAIPPGKNATVPFKCEFHGMFLRVGVTKYCKLQYKMLPGRAAG